MLEFLKQPGIYEAALFFSGVIFYKILMYVMAIHHMKKYYKEVGLSSFNIILTAYIMSLTALEQKQKFLEQANVDKKIIKNILEEDKAEIDSWRDLSLRALYEFAPRVFREINDTFNKKGNLQ
tara:strand:+ start:291 stop:659 length:369 start_codon:yes stop_codon:yes gene_type:complete